MEITNKKALIINIALRLRMLMLMSKGEPDFKVGQRFSLEKQIRMTTLATASGPSCQL